jgi:hypothetical protein
LHDQLDVADRHPVADQRLAAQAGLQEIREQCPALRLRHRQVVELGELADRQVAAEGELPEDIAAARGFGPLGEHLVERGGLLGRCDHQHGVAGIEPVQIAWPEQPAVAHDPNQARVLELQQPAHAAH